MQFNKDILAALCGSCSDPLMKRGASYEIKTETSVTEQPTPQV